MAKITEVQVELGKVYKDIQTFHTMIQKLNERFFYLDFINRLESNSICKDYTNLYKASFKFLLKELDRRINYRANFNSQITNVIDKFNRQRDEELKKRKL
jgi:hypothetical protein